jgi:hypothetical protein
VLKITNVGQNVFATLKHGNIYVLNLAEKKDWAKFWAIFFTKSSGHPGRGHCWSFKKERFFKVKF